MYEGMTRQWEPHPRYEDLMISNYGDVCNTTTDRILTPTETSKGLFQVKYTYAPHKKLGLYVHRLVAEVFLPDFDLDYVVAFKNGNMADFCIHNLEMSHKRARPMGDHDDE